MDQILRRAAVLTGGCVAGIALALSISSAAQADDRPGLVDGLLGTVTEVVDNVLPPQAEKPERDREPKPERPEPPKPDRPEKPGPPARPVKDIVDTVVDVVDEVVDGTPAESVLDAVTNTPSNPAANPAAAGGKGKPAATEDPAPAPTTLATPATPVVPGLPRAPTALADAAHGPAAANAQMTYTANCRPSHNPGDRGGAVESDRGAADKPRDRVVPEKRRTALYRTPRPPPPPSPDRDVTPSVGTAAGATGASQLDATLTARATQPRTHAAPVRDRYRSSHGTTSRPVAPSG